MDLEYIELPKHFCHLLLNDVSSSNTTSIDLQEYIFNSPAMSRILFRILNHGEKTDLTSLIKKYGWHGIRDRMLTYYIHFLENNSHPHTVLIDEVSDITAFEARFREKTVSGYSRLTSLAFYLRVSCYEMDINNIEDHPFFPSQVVDEALRNTKHRTVRIDILILMLEHFIKYLGEDTVLGLISSDPQFDVIASLLTMEQRGQLQRNILNYALSIGDLELVAAKTV